MFQLSSPSMTRLSSSSDRRSQTQLAGIQDELRDIKRVQTQGQEEDLRMALGRTITRIEELSSMLTEQYTVQTEIQTELTLCKSNLQLALANNEMLEEALKRDTAGRGKDLGWRRQQPSSSSEAERSSTSFDTDRPSLDSSPVLPEGGPNGGVNQDNRFFRFRFGNSGSGRTTPQAHPVVQNGIHPTHLSSASLPSLDLSKDKEMEHLTSELELERKAHRDIVDEKKKLEEELESLSQALFEEANKMVAVERMKLADVEAELHQLRDEKDALRSALRLIEDENRKFLSSRDQDISNVPPAARSRSRSRSDSRANSLPPSAEPSFSSKPPSPAPRPHSALSNTQSSASLSTSRSASPEPTFVTPSMGPLDYDSSDISPWAEPEPSGMTSTSEIRMSTLSNVDPSHSPTPPPPDVPPWSAGVSTPTQSVVTPKYSLTARWKPSFPRQDVSLPTVPGSS